MAIVETRVEISICMGSSCFSRGNRKNLEALQTYIHRHALEGRVELKGNLCEGLCKQGPNMRIGGKVYHQLTPETVVDALEEHFGSNG